MRDKVKLHVWHNGDPTTGVGGDAAEVTITLPSGEREAAQFIDVAKDLLQEAFTTLWDYKAYVMTEDEAKEEVD